MRTYVAQPSGQAGHDDALESPGSACTSGIPEPSHVLRAIGLSIDEAEASIRFSIGRGTNDMDLEEAVRIIEETLARLASVKLARAV